MVGGGGSASFYFFRLFFARGFLAVSLHISLSAFLGIGIYLSSFFFTLRLVSCDFAVL